MARLRLTLVVLGTGLLATAARADILIVTEQGNTPVPMQETQISMDAETVRIRPLPAFRHNFQATCTFRMRSHSRSTITRKMAFPVVDTRYSYHLRESFKVEVQEGGTFRRVPVKVKMKRKKATWADEFYFKPPHDSFDYPGYVVWDVTWKPGETKVIRCTYDMGSARQHRGIVDGWSVLYVVRTGALWKGPIGRAEISIDFERDVRSHRTAATPLITTYPKQARWTSPKKVRWRFTNWVPKEDIRVRSLGWVGLTKENKKSYFYALPHPYRGDRLRYTAKTIGKLVEAELQPWKRHFPGRCARLDRAALGRIIASWLYHEILARHGDPFLLGKPHKGRWPKGAAMETGGYVYSRWHTNFQAYMYHGGWYRPRMGPKGRVTPKMLTPMERKNLAFLKRRM